MLKVRHHLISIVEPDFNFTAGEFCKRAGEAVEVIEQKGHLPVFVGGTGLYIDSYFKGMSDIPSISVETKIKVSEALDNYDIPYLFEELKKVDFEFAEKIHLNDKQRILRGLEVFWETGKPISHFHAIKKGRESNETLYIGLTLERSVLRKRIDDRVDQMIAEGFFDEVEQLRRMGFSRDLKSMSSIGYNEINDFFDGNLTKNQCIDRIKTVTKQYAKRQMTWFRKNKKIEWFHPDETKKIKNVFEKWREKWG